MKYEDGERLGRADGQSGVHPCPPLDSELKYIGYMAGHRHGTWLRADGVSCNVCSAGGTSPHPPAGCDCCEKFHIGHVPASEESWCADGTCRPSKRRLRQALRVHGSGTAERMRIDYRQRVHGHDHYPSNEGEREMTVALAVAILRRAGAGSHYL